MPQTKPALNEIYEVLEESASYSKKDLQDIYGKADTTISKTLEACGLSTSRRNYTGAEIKTRFHLARKNMDELGWDYEMVRDHFKQGTQINEDVHTSNPQNEPSANGYAHTQGEESVSAVDMAMFKLLNQSAQSSAQKAGSILIPLLNIHLAQTLSDPNGEFQKNLDSQIKQIAADNEGNSLTLLEQGARVIGLMPYYEAPTNLLMPSESGLESNENKNEPRQLDLFADHQPSDL